MTLRLYFDADVNPAAARLLRDRGIDAVSCHDFGARHESDEWHLRRATSERRVVFTYNVGDFIRLAIRFAELGEEHAGIIGSYRQYTNDGLGIFADVLHAFIADRNAEDIANVMLILPRPRIT